MKLGQIIESYRKSEEHQKITSLLYIIYNTWREKDQRHVCKPSGYIKVWMGIHKHLQLLRIVDLLLHFYL